MQLFTRRSKKDPPAVAHAQAHFTHALDELDDAVGVHRDVLGALVAADPYLKEMLLNLGYREEELVGPHPGQPVNVSVAQAERSLTAVTSAAYRAAEQVARAMFPLPGITPAVSATYRAELGTAYSRVRSLVDGSVPLSAVQKTSAFAKSIGCSASEAAALHGRGRVNSGGFRAAFLLDDAGEPVLLVKWYDGSTTNLVGYFTGPEAERAVNAWRADGALAAAGTQPPPARTVTGPAGARPRTAGPRPDSGVPRRR